MLFTYSTAASLLAFSGLATAAAINQKRASYETTLFAYGAGSDQSAGPNGAPVFYSNGKSISLRRSQQHFDW
jgi:hypothetical protein